MRKNSSSLLLIELIFSILFLSLVGGTTLLVFAKARVLSDNTVAVNRAVLLAESRAEEFTAGAQTDPEKIFYSKDWKETDEAGAVYVMTCTPEEKDSGLQGLRITITVKSTEKELYSLEALRHERGRLS